MRDIRVELLPTHTEWGCGGGLRDATGVYNGVGGGIVT